MTREKKSVNGKYMRAGHLINVPTPATPIKSKEDLFKIRQALKGENPEIKKPHDKYSMLFEIACTIGLRVTDTLDITPRNILEGTPIYEKKTGKRRSIIVNDRLKDLVRKYMEKYHLQLDDVLIFANRKDGRKDKPIDKSQAYRKLKEIIEKVCPEVHFSNHTTRKTWAWSFYLATGKDIAKVQKVMGHTSSLITADYIGLSRQELKAELEKFDPFE